MTRKQVMDLPGDLASLKVPLNSVKPVPGNPRRGDVDLIAESLAAHGQYRPIVTRDGHILAGNHTWMAAKSLGWTHIAAVEVECDDATATKIVLADNRTSDQSNWNEPALAAVLGDLDDLTGTGFDPDDLERLLSRVEHQDTFADALDTVMGHTRLTAPDRRVTFTFGLWDFGVPHEAYEEWAQTHKAEDIATMVRWPTLKVEPLPEPDPEPEVEVEPLTEAARMDSGELVAVRGLTPLKIGRKSQQKTIAESLLILGQYRPIVIDTDGTVIVGWGVVEAARKSKITHLRAVRIDVTREQALRIALMDNRSADLAWYDNTSLAAMLESVEDLLGTGFTEGRRLFEMESGGLQVTAPDPLVGLRVQSTAHDLKLHWKATAKEYDIWAEQVLREGGYSLKGALTVLADRIGMDPAVLRARRGE